MEEDEDIKKVKKEKNYEEFSIENLFDEIKRVKKNKIFRRFTQREEIWP